MATTRDLEIRIDGKLSARIAELERVFGHWHSRAVKGDLCTYCGLNLRDQIHFRQKREGS